MKRLSPVLLCFILPFAVLAGNDTIYSKDTFKKQKDSAVILQHRMTILKITGGVVYAGMLTGLANSSYKNNLQSQFHVYHNFSDWRLFMDKTHHAIATYQTGKIGYGLLRWAGANEQRATWLGGISGLFLLTSQEIFDGFSSKWCASSGDMAANVMGSAIFISQQLAWHEQRLLLKWSYHPTSYPNYNPEQLGCNFAQKIIKDYNGQTFWLSANIQGFFRRYSCIPKWLNVAVGYGVTGITGTVADPLLYRDIPFPSFEKRSFFCIAPDIDLTHIHTQSTVIRWLFEAIGFLKFPLPKIEISGEGVKFHPIYF